MTHDTPSAPPSPALSPDDAAIVAEECGLAAHVCAHLAARVAEERAALDFDGELVTLRDQVAEAKPEDVAPLLEQMHRAAALRHHVGQGSAAAVDASSPYFGHLGLAPEDAAPHDVLLGKQTYIDTERGVRIVDWRHAPVSRVFYQYREGQDYAETFGGRTRRGTVTIRRTVTIQEGQVERVTTDDAVFWRGADGAFHRTGSGRFTLAGGGGAVPPPASRGTLGGPGAVLRADKHLPDIAALIDPVQFRLITAPDAGVVVLHGVAGSGKTTVGLHRMAYLAYADPRRFDPRRMVVILFSRALKDYISRVLPGLGVEGVRVLTFGEWAHGHRVRLFPRLPRDIATDTPAVVTRAKKHPAMLRLLEAAVAARAQAVRDRLAAIGFADDDRALVLEAFDRTAHDPGAPPDRAVRTLGARTALLADWVARRQQVAGVKRKRLSDQAAFLFDQARPAVVALARDVVGVWEELVTDRAALAAGFAQHAPGAFSEADVARVHDWCVRQHAARERDADTTDSGEPVALDAEDDTLLLRLHQIQVGPLVVNRDQLIQFSHLFVDECQDLSPVELTVLLEVVDKRRSVTLAGDPAQRMLSDNGFESWEETLRVLGLEGLHIAPLRVAYRSTAAIMAFARTVLGHLADPRDTFETTRAGAPVEFLSFSDHGEAVAFLAEALQRTVSAEPRANIALIARRPETADLVYDGLDRAMVSNVRRVRDQDFAFAPGIDVTDIYQVKGLEFDYVVLLEVSAEQYPATDESRYLLHIGATRAAHQLWLVATKTPSPLVPADLVRAGFGG